MIGTGISPSGETRSAADRRGIPMKIERLDKQEYQSIPIYEIGCESGWTLPISIRRYNESNFRLSPFHRHRIFQINYIAYGRLMHKINNQMHELVKGDIIVIPPYVPHQLIGIEGERHEVVELEFKPEFIFSEELISSYDIHKNDSAIDFFYVEPFLVGEGEVRPGLNLRGQEQKKVEQLLEEMEKEQEGRQDSFMLAMKAALLTLLVIVLRTFREIHRDSANEQLFKRYRESVERAVLYIGEHYKEHLTLRQVAGISYLSPSYFSYLFKVMTGKTFTEYLNGLRLEKAMDLLVKADDRVADICVKTGFQNVNHFDRLFRMKVGVSPTQYRRIGTVYSARDAEKKR